MRINDGQYVRVICKSKNEMPKLLEHVKSNFAVLFGDLELVDKNKCYFMIHNNHNYGASGDKIAQTITSCFPLAKVAQCAYYDGKNFATCQWSR